MVWGRGCDRGAGNAALSEVADANAAAFTSCAAISAVGMENSNANAISHFMIFAHAPVWSVRCSHWCFALPTLGNSFIVRVYFAAKRRAVKPAASKRRRNL